MNIYFLSLGCDKNLVDSEIMLGILNAEGHKITNDPQEADVIIVNTCGFIADAADEGVQSILELSEYKKTGCCKALVVTGCMVQRYKEEIFKELPEVDAVVGTNDFEEIGNVIKDASEGKKVQIISDRHVSEDSHLKRMMATPQHFAYLKIAEGCDAFCTYCTIPSIRGKYRSRSMESLVQEAKILAEKGVKELIIVAQDTALYGKDLYGEPQLHLLLRKLSEIEGIYWLRVLYAYPENVTSELISEMSANPKICHYLDIPIQHGSDTVLKRMGRRSSSKKIRDTVKKLRKAMPDISLRTSIIVGFPGETEEEFAELVSFVSDVKFDRLGVFAYSKERGTPAFEMRNHLLKAVKEKRRKKIMAVQMDISSEKCKSLIGEVLEVIVDGKIPEEGVYCGRSYKDCYDVDGMVFFESSTELLTGDIVKVKVIGSSEYDLSGVMTDEFTE